MSDFQPGDKVEIVHTEDCFTLSNSSGSVNINNDVFVNVIGTVTTILPWDSGQMELDAKLCTPNLVPVDTSGFNQEVEWAMIPTTWIKKIEEPLPPIFEDIDW